MILNNARTAIRFEAGRYPNSRGQEITFPAIDLSTALISVGQAKRIVTTVVDGQDGSVKEYIGLDDFSVQVSGMITGSPGVEPIQQRIDLNKMLIAPVPIEVVCPYLQNLGIHLLIVESYDLPQDPGGVSYQKFSINFRSETPKELRIV